MIVTRCPRLLVAAFVACGAMAAPAAAQITTGTVAGTVVDGQAGVVPGATVVLLSETQRTRSTPVVTNQEGQYVIPNVRADRYTVEVTMQGFKNISRPGVIVSGGERVAVEPLVLAVGGQTETVTVTAESPVIQAESGERSSTLQRIQLASLPVSSHNFMDFVGIQPGINTGSMSPGSQMRRVGGGGQDNIMLDGISALDTGNNGLMSGMNLPEEAILEIKVLTSSYQAEYGRSSGLQISAVTRGGTNQFRGSFYDYERNSDWNSNSWANKKNGNPKNVSRERDWGYSIGGPVGKPGGRNKLFFFYSHEFRPREQGNDTNNFRMPTELERRGDFSQTRDNNGALYNFIYDPNSGLPKTSCSATVQTACFQDGGVIGRIPINRLYGPGMALLNQYPLPNVEAAAGQSFNYTVTTPLQKTLGYTPIVRVDYQISNPLRVTAKSTNANARVVPDLGNLPGYTDQLQKFPWSFNTAVTVNYSINSDHVPRGDLRDQSEPARDAQHQQVLEPQRRALSGQPRRTDLELHARRHHVPLSGRRRDEPGVLRARRAAAGRDALLLERPDSPAAPVRLGQHAHRRRAAEHQLPGVHERQPDSAVGRQRHQGDGIAHGQGRAVLRAQLQGAEHRREPDVPGQPELRRRHQQPHRLPDGVLERRARRLLDVRPGVAVHRGQLLLQQPRVVPAGQLEGEPPVDARLRHPRRP